MYSGDALGLPKEAVGGLRTHNEDISPLEGRALHLKYRSRNTSQEPLEDLALIKDERGWGSDSAVAGRPYLTGKLTARAHRTAAGQWSTLRVGGASVVPFLRIRPGAQETLPRRGDRRPTPGEEHSAEIRRIVRRTMAGDNKRVEDGDLVVPNRLNDVTNGMTNPSRSLRHPITGEEK